jgi:hypothetical protein
MMAEGALSVKRRTEPSGYTYWFHLLAFTHHFHAYSCPEVRTKGAAMRVYVHRAGAAVSVEEIEPDAGLREQLGVDTGELWLEGRDEPVTGDDSSAALGVDDKAHVFIGTCRKVDVMVRFNGQNKDHPFPPSATIAQVHKWATGPAGFDMPDVDAAEHVLQMANSDVQPEDTDHVGEHTDSDQGCAVTFDLLPKERFEG